MPRVGCSPKTSAFDGIVSELLVWGLVATVAPALVGDSCRSGYLMTEDFVGDGDRRICEYDCLEASSLGGLSISARQRSPED